MTIITRCTQKAPRKPSPIVTLLLSIAVWAASAPQAGAQNVGIGTTSPQKKLSITGSVLVDQGNKNYGSLDSAALLFGSTGGTGIASKKVGTSPNDLRLYTGGQSRLNISSEGRVAIGGAISDSYLLNVNGSGIFQGSVRSTGSIRADENMSVNGNIDPAYRLRVYDGNSRFGGDVHATGKAAIGGDVDPDFRLRVYNGNSRFGGDAEVTGTLNTTNLAVANNLTIGGKGSVRSNGTSPLKIHFTSVFVDHTFTGSGQLAVFPVNLPDFDNADDVRLSISHFDAIVPVGYNPQNVLAFFSDLDPVENKAVLVLRSIKSSDFIIGGTYYITAIMKDN